MNNELDWVLISRNGWGDMFVDYANICKLNRKVNVVFYGYDKTIIQFLKHQDNIEEVYQIEPDNAIDYLKAPIALKQKENIKALFEQNSLNINFDKFIMMHTERLETISREIKFNLPKSDIKITKPSLLFNPYSIQSLTYENHCPLIPEIFTWLIESTKWNIVLIGQEFYNHVYFGKLPFPLKIKNENEVSNLQNLVGKTKSMIDVFNIAKQCEGIITTSNNLSMWSVITNKPAIILLNDLMSNPKDRKAVQFYKNWIDQKPNTLLNYDCNPQQFMETFAKWEKTL